MTYPMPHPVHHNHSNSAFFVVLKGYHMGSKWFEEAFRKVAGCSFYFEYEHCLKQLAPAPQIASIANVTLQYLRSSCGCPYTPGCLGCSPEPPMQVPLPPLPVTPPMPSPPPRPRRIAHRKRIKLEATGNASKSARVLRTPGRDALKVHEASHKHRLSSSTQHRLPNLGGCRASGISLGSLTTQYIGHVQALLAAAPDIQVVVHVRSNHVKHAFSFLRHSCPDQVNHLVKGTEAFQRNTPLRPHVPPALFSSRTFAAAQSMLKLMDHAKGASGGRGTAAAPCGAP